MATNDGKSLCPDCGSVYGKCWHTKPYDDPTVGILHTSPNFAATSSDVLHGELATLRAENARLRGIVEEMTGWHTDFIDSLESVYNFDPTMDDVKAMCEQAWKAINDGT